MASLFAITTPTSSAALDANRRTAVSFTVSNTSGRAVRGRGRVAPVDAAAAAWLTLAGAAERDFPAGGTEQYTVQIAVPAAAPAGNYAFRFDMLGVENPDEDITQGPTVAFTVPAPVVTKKPFPWWIVAVAALVLIVAAVLAIRGAQAGRAATARNATATASAFQTAAAITNATAAAQVTATAAAAANATATAAALAEAVPSATPEPAPSPSPSPTPAPSATATLTPTIASTSSPTATPDRTTTVQLSAEPAGSVALDQSVTFTALVEAAAGSQPEGTVQFSLGGRQALAGCETVPVANGTATCTTRALPVGAHSIVATYSGEASHAASAAALNYTINPADTSITISASSPYEFPSGYRYQASVTVNNTVVGQARIPTGTVSITFTDNAAVNRTETCRLDSRGSCSVGFQTLLVYYQVSARYQPDNDNFKPSTSAKIGTGR